MAPLSRRALFRGTALSLAGAAVGVLGAEKVPRWAGWDHPPLSGGYAAAADTQTAIGTADVTVRYYVKTSTPVVALTFDDGPGPNYTSMAFDALEKAGVPATFFMVGQNVQKHSDLVRDRLTGHEVGNHSWRHRDLATMDLAAIRDDLIRTQDMIEDKLGRTPTLMRPPYGHIGGSTLLAADSLGYDVILWNRQMRELMFRDDPDGQARDLIASVQPGSIILAHDIGDRRRLVGLGSIPTLVAGLKDKGYRFATVSEMIAEAARPNPA
jgi:peptidoglycan-N-acetylglucosamine deacetylase